MVTAPRPEFNMRCCVCRAVLESFRARHVRQEGVAVFHFWRDWAHWRALERRAIVAHWQKLMLLVRHLAHESVSTYCLSRPMTCHRCSAALYAADSECAHAQLRWESPTNYVAAHPARASVGFCKLEAAP